MDIQVDSPILIGVRIYTCSYDYTYIHSTKTWHTLPKKFFTLYQTLVDKIIVDDGCSELLIGI